MHIENELVEYAILGEQEYEEVIEEYEEILVQEGEEVSKPPVTDFVDANLAQGKLLCITH
jgi:hypothetical protein